MRSQELLAEIDKLGISEKIMLVDNFFCPQGIYDFHWPQARPMKRLLICVIREIRAEKTNPFFMSLQHRWEI